jgi:hypothetical protein
VKNFLNTLQVTGRDKTAAEILNMTTLSGGEAQRIKLVTELVKVRENEAGV